MIDAAELDDEPSLLMSWAESVVDGVCCLPSLLMSSEQEPEAWSVTVDLKTLKKMTAKNIKRQDHIWGQSRGRRLVIVYHYAPPYRERKCADTVGMHWFPGFTIFKAKNINIFLKEICGNNFIKEHAESGMV